MDWIILFGSAGYHIEGSRNCATSLYRRFLHHQAPLSLALLLVHRHLYYTPQ